METPAWSSREKALFRFGLLYFFLHFFPFPLPRFESLSWLTNPFYELTGAIVRAVGVRLLSLPAQRAAVGGNGDRADDYLGIAIELTLALAGAAVWSGLDCRRPHYRSLAYWATVGLRYTLAFTMLGYGIIKVLKSQFPFPGPMHLTTPLGELSPMRVLWLMMGISPPYCAFIGSCELLGASLLFFRRTLLAGALLTFGVLLNVFLMNVFFGVYVKLISAHLLLMAFLLILPDARRLLGAVLGRAAPAREWLRPSLSPRRARALDAIKLMIVSGLLLHTVAYGRDAWHSYGDAAPKPPLYGIWDVERFTRKGELVPADGQEPQRWTWLAVDSDNRASLQLAQGKARSVKVATNPASGHLGLRIDPASSATIVFRYSEPEPAVLELTGELDGALTLIRLKQRPLEQYPLLQHRFRWTSDL
jgi:hypothetical protein